MLAGLDAGGRHPAALLVAVATAGNVLGALVNWLLGRFLMRYRGRRWFPVGARAIDRATGWYRRWGVWSLLFAWLPFIGDPLTFIDGMLRVRFWLFVLLVGAGKGGRYAAALAGAEQAFG